MSAKQLQLFHEKNLTKQFGGTLLKGRKSKRPLSTRSPIHLILRSNHKESARALSYRIKQNRLLLEKVAKKFHIRVYQSVFNYTHVHLVIKIPSRKAYVSFIRLFSSGLAELAALKEGKLFSLRPFTRILSWGREFKFLLNYINKNICEAIGVITVARAEIPAYWSG